MRSIKLSLLVALIVPIELLSQQATWEMVRSNFWGKIAIDPTNPNIIYVSPGDIFDYGLHKSTDGGKTWVKYEQGYEGLATVNGIVMDPNNPQRLWVYSWEGGKGVVRSEDGGMTAVRADTGIVPDHHGYSIATLAYDSKRDILYAGFSAVFTAIYRSFDGGRRWELAIDIPSGLRFNPQFFLVEEDSGWVYSGTGAHGIWRSKDFGVTWTPLHPEVLSGQPIFRLAKVPNSRTLYAANLLGNFYKSYDLGEQWTSTNARIDSNYLSEGLAVSTLDTNYVYLGTTAGSGNGGFYLSRDNGSSWQLYHIGLPQDVYRVWSFQQTSNSRYLYMSVFVVDQSKNGIYRLSQGLLTSVQDHASPFLAPNFYLLQNYPNPFNSQTRIDFFISKNDRIKLDVYNIRGEHIASLFNQQLSEGNHTVQWNGKDSKGGDAPSGIYLIRMKSNEGILIRKMLLIR